MGYTPSNRMIYDLQSWVVIGMVYCRVGIPSKENKIWAWSRLRFLVCPNIMTLYVYIYIPDYITYLLGHLEPVAVSSFFQMFLLMESMRVSHFMTYQQWLMVSFAFNLIYFWMIRKYRSISGLWNGTRVFKSTDTVRWSPWLYCLKNWPLVRRNFCLGQRGRKKE